MEAGNTYRHRTKGEKIMIIEIPVSYLYLGTMLSFLVYAFVIGFFLGRSIYKPKQMKGQTNEIHSVTHTIDISGILPTENR